MNQALSPAVVPIRPLMTPDPLAELYAAKA
jgi:hypothetical protein